MRKEKNAAIILRKKGLSYTQIKGRLGISKSTLSFWLKDIELSVQAKEKISRRVHATSILALIKRNKNQTALALQRALEVRKRAKNEVAVLIRNPLFAAGVALYWAEGYKKGAQGSKWKSVDFANSDPEMILVMMKFFRRICKVPQEKFNVQLIAHPNIDIAQEVEYWSGLTKIPKTRFIKTCTSVSSHSKGLRGKHGLTHGTVHIRINDVMLFFRIIGWIDGLKSRI